MGLGNPFDRYLTEKCVDEAVSATVWALSHCLEKLQSKSGYRRALCQIQMIASPP